MNEVTRILSEVEQGDPLVAERLFFLFVPPSAVWDKPGKPSGGTVLAKRKLPLLYSSDGIDSVRRAERTTDATLRYEPPRNTRLTVFMTTNSSFATSLSSTAASPMSFGYSLYVS